MTDRALTRAIVKRFILDADRIVLATGKPIDLKTRDHQITWPKIQAALEKAGARGLTYSTIKAMGGTNKDFAAYLIGDRQYLRCPALEERLSARLHEQVPQC